MPHATTPAAYALIYVYIVINIFFCRLILFRAACRLVTTARILAALTVLRRVTSRDAQMRAALIVRPASRQTLPSAYHISLSPAPIPLPCRKGDGQCRPSDFPHLTQR